MAHNIFTSRGEFMIHISSSSIGLMTHDIININIRIGLKQWIKAHDPYYLLIIMESGFSNKSPYLHKITTKPEVRHLIFGSGSKLMSLFGKILGVVVWRAKKYV